MVRSHDAVAVSAPGKVLLAGGYLVLDRKYTGLVFALDARLHVVIEDIPTRNGVTLSEITVQSPQFRDAVWEYGYRLAEGDGGISVTQLRVDADLNLTRNLFIETALGYALSYIATVASPLITPASITILADNDYYSTPADIANATPSSNTPRFHHFDVPLSRAHKTGLGSSAALVTAFTAALLTYYLPKDTFDLHLESGQRSLHNLAQAAHCAAQGKVGSGFDVASAVYGSCLYRRFSPAILCDNLEPGTPGFAAQLKNVVDETGQVGRWDTAVSKNEVKVPHGLRLVMCDVAGGSKTPGMVKQVLAWRKDKPEEAEAIWLELQAANEGLARELTALAESQHAAANDDGALTRCFQRIRHGLRRMSSASGVPIEPPSQTQLLDACAQVSGVLGGVVPGAGGYDAISLLIEDREQTVSELERLLTGWRFPEGDNEDAGGRVRILGVREEMEGIRFEEARRYEEYMP